MATGRPAGGPGRFAEIEKAEDVGGTLKRIVKYFADEKKLVISLFAIVIMSTVLGLWAPSLQSNAIDIIAGSRGGVLATTLILMLVTYLLNGLGNAIQGRQSARLSQHIIGRLRTELFGKVVDLPVGYIDNQSKGDLMSRMTNDIDNVSNTVSQSLISMFSGILTIIGTVVIMFAYCWQLALLSLITVVFTLGITKLMSGKVRKYSRVKQEYLGVLNGIVNENVTGYRTVLAYNYQRDTIKEFDDASDILTRSGIRADALSGIMGPAMNAVSNIGFVIIAAFGGFFATKGMISIGVISAFIVYAKQFSRPINELAQIYGSLQTAVAGAERVFKVMDEQSENTEGSESMGSRGEVSFENINFSYVPEKQVLFDFSLKVPSGKKVALVGTTGCGKTTVVNLLMRFYNPDSGRITIDGRDISRIPLKEHRSEMAIVLQETVLFADTILANLKYSEENPTMEQIEKAIDMSHCREMIEALPDGVNTMLSPSGTNLSQGQRQLLSIARAFVSNPKILILDEATSSVDTRTEKMIQDAMTQIMKDRTSIVIAHRLSTIQDADLIVVMDAGRIVEQGNHKELLERKGVYYELYMTQYAGFEI